MRAVSWMVRAKLAPNAVAGLSAPRADGPRVSSTARIAAAGVKAYESPVSSQASDQLGDEIRASCGGVRPDRRAQGKPGHVGVLLESVSEALEDRDRVSHHQIDGDGSATVVFAQRASAASLVPVDDREVLSSPRRCSKRRTSLSMGRPGPCCISSSSGLLVSAPRIRIHCVVSPSWTASRLSTARLALTDVSVRCSTAGKARCGCPSGGGRGAPRKAWLVRLGAGA
jgi:hypothetical protein